MDSKEAADSKDALCIASSCGKKASMICPTCAKLGLPKSHFCSQECFKATWSTHNKVHKEAKLRAEYKAPSFRYTGPLRPHYVTPMRDVPSSIQQPDYAHTGQPVSEELEKRSAKIPIYSAKEIAGIREACRIGREVLDIAAKMVRPGVTTEEIDVAVHEATIARDAYPSPLNYYGFPKSCCTSVNEVICHGIPDARPLQDGDIVNLDISVFHKGYHGDLNETYCVGEVDEESKRLIRVTHDSLMAAIALVRPDTMCRDFGDVITRVVSKHGYQVVRSYCGHGIGHLFHCMPNIPHYARNKAVGVLKPGMVFTIEPMINAGTWHDELWTFDDWTSVTKDGKRSAQFEHTMVVTETGCELLTTRTATSLPYFWETKEQFEAVVASKGVVKGGVIPGAPPLLPPGSGPEPAPSASASVSEAGAGTADKKKKKKKGKKKTGAGGAGAAAEAGADDDEDMETA